MVNKNLNKYQVLNKKLMRLETLKEKKKLTPEEKKEKIKLETIKENYFKGNITYTRKYKNMDIFISEIEKKGYLKNIISFLNNDIPKETGKFIDRNSREEIFFILWILSEDDFYLKINNFHYTWLLISSALLINQTINHIFYEIVENQESKFLFFYEWVFYKIKEKIEKFNEEKNKKISNFFYSQGKFTPVTTLYGILKKLINEKSIPKTLCGKIDQEMKNQIKLCIKDHDNFKLFRNSIVHTETKFYHLIQCAQPKINSDDKEIINNYKEIEKIKKAYTYIVKNIYLDKFQIEKLINELDWCLKRVYDLDNTETKIKEKISNDIENYFKLILESLKLIK